MSQMDNTATFSGSENRGYQIGQNLAPVTATVNNYYDRVSRTYTYGCLCW